MNKAKQSFLNKVSTNSKRSYSFILKYRNIAIPSLILIIVLIVSYFVTYNKNSNVPFSKSVSQYIHEENTFISNNQEDQAAALLTEAIKIYPNNIQIKTELARLDYSLKKYNEAISLYESIDKTKMTATSTNNLANVYRDKGNIDKAKELYNEAIRIDPKYSSPYINLATILNSENKSAEAIDLLNRGITNGAAGGSITYTLASSYIKTGDKTKAKKILNDWLAKNPDDQSAKIILQNTK